MDTPRAKLLRRSGYTVMISLTLFFTIPMGLGAVNGISSKRIWDPNTGEMLSDAQNDQMACAAVAEQLIRESGAMTRKEAKWEEQLRLWTVRCRSDHPEAYEMLMATRRHIGETKAPQPE